MKVQRDDDVEAFYEAAKRGFCQFWQVIVETDVGKDMFRAFGRDWVVRDFMQSSIRSEDVGKRVHVKGDRTDAVRLETAEEYAKRLQRERDHQKILDDYRHARAKRLAERAHEHYETLLCNATSSHPQSRVPWDTLNAPYRERLVAALDAALLDEETETLKPWDR